MQSSSPPPASRPSEQIIRENVRVALAEDIGSGDVTARLIPVETQGKARIITREAAILCGQDWVNEVFRQIDADIQLHWLVAEGSAVSPDQTLVELHGALRHLLTAERCALNFLQSLSGTATTCHQFAERVKHTQVKLLDTRKTIPGLRLAQKYAVRVGGCFNHRVGLYDAFLIKENHIAACGGITTAVTRAREQSPGKAVEVEVENFDELQQALNARADIIMLDNFSLVDIAEAVRRARADHKPCLLEASGGINNDNLIAVAETGVDYISIGGLTKHLRAIDLSMRVL